MVVSGGGDVPLRSAPAELQAYRISAPPQGELRSEDQLEAVIDARRGKIRHRSILGEDRNRFLRPGEFKCEAGIDLDPDRLDLFFDTVQMVKNGTGCGMAAETEATAGTWYWS